jgi:hypothetical protein
MSTTLSVPLARSLRRLDEGEEGMLSLVSLFVVLGFLVLIGLLANAGLVAARKVETQNAADSVAYSASIEMARGMNSITAINHLIGELTAVVIMVHTLGGDDLDKGKKPSTPQSLQQPLKDSYEAAKDICKVSSDVPVLEDAYDEAKKDSQVGGAIYDSRMRLKKVLTWAFEAHAVGAGIAAGKDIPYIGPILEAIGDGISGSAVVFEAKVDQECRTLDLLEQLDKDALNPLKKLVRDVFIKILYEYGTATVFATPFEAGKAIGAIGAPNLADCSSFPPSILLELPVTKEPAQLDDPKKSQLIRAATPWVQWWRQPWMDFGKRALLLSRFACAVETRSTQYTLSIVKSLKEDKSINLYVLKDLDLNGSGKTHERWTYSQNSSRADQLFTVVGFAHRPAPDVASGGIFRQENPDGIVCYAQAMFYNANPQQRDSGDKNWQPTAGWDTLNWANRVPEYPGPVPSGDDCPTPTTPQPRIQLNWQCKLIPTTRLTEAALFQTGPIGRVLRRTLPDEVFKLPRTH